MIVSRVTTSHPSKVRGVVIYGSTKLSTSGPGGMGGQRVKHRGVDSTIIQLACQVEELYLIDSSVDQTS